MFSFPFSVLKFTNLEVATGVPRHDEGKKKGRLSVRFLWKKAAARIRRLAVSALYISPYDD